MGYCCTLVMPPAQCFDGNFHTVWASVCDKSVVYFFFQAAATVKISTNLEHFENLDRYASVTTYIETCRAQSMFFSGRQSISALIFEPFNLDHPLRALWNRCFQALRMEGIPTFYLQLFSNASRITEVFKLKMVSPRVQYHWHLRTL